MTRFFSFNDKQKGILALFIAVLFSTAGSSCFKALEGDYPLGQRMFFLFFMLPTFVVLLGLYNGKLKEYVGTKYTKTHILQGIGGFIIDGFYYFSLPLLSLAKGTTLYMSYVPVMGFLSGLVNREPYTKKQWLSVLVGFAGVVIAVHPDSSFFAGDQVASIAMLISALLTALSILYFRQVSVAESPWATLGWMGFYVTLISIGVMSVTTVIPLVNNDLWIFLACGVGSLGWYLPLTYAYSKAPSGSISSWGYMLIPVHAIFGWIFFQEHLEMHIVWGAALLICSGLLILEKDEG